MNVIIQLVLTTSPSPLLSLRPKLFCGDCAAQ
jgi:hypothetical protein